MFFILALLACEPEPIPESTPLLRSEKGGGKVEMKVGPEGLKPVPIQTLIGFVPRLGEKRKDVQQAAVAAMNLVPGPCASCDGTPLAHCLINPASQCTVASTLAQRAVALADKGVEGGDLKAALNYPDHWFPDLGSGVPVKVILWRDSAGPFGSETETIRSELADRYGAQVNWVVNDADTSAPEHLDVRARPTWFINGHRFRGMQSAQTLDRFIGYELSEAK